MPLTGTTTLVRVDLGELKLKMYATLTKTQELESYEQMKFRAIPLTLAIIIVLWISSKKTLTKI